MPYKLKHKETGLYWKGGTSCPFDDVKLNPGCWSKSGKSWNQKQNLSSAMSQPLHKEYISGFYDYSNSKETYDRFVSECIVEFYQDAVEINVKDFKPMNLDEPKKIQLKIEQTYGNEFLFLFGNYVNVKKFLVYVLDRNKITHYPDKKYTNFKRRMKIKRNFIYHS